jgi:hypothetical protein
MVSVSYTYKVGLVGRSQLLPRCEEKFFTFMHIHIDIGKVISVNKNEAATKIHPQGPRPALGLSVETKP